MANSRFLELFWPDLFSHVVAFNYNGPWITALKMKAVELIYRDTSACTLVIRSIWLRRALANRSSGRVKHSKQSPLRA